MDGYSSESSAFECDTYEYHGQIIRPGDVFKTHNKEFLFVTQITPNESEPDDTMVCGFYMVKPQHLGGLFAYEHGADWELCFFWEVNLSNRRTPERQALRDFKVVELRRKVSVTFLQPDAVTQMEDCGRRSHYFCRWRYTHHYKENDKRASLYSGVIEAWFPEFPATKQHRPERVGDAAIPQRQKTYTYGDVFCGCGGMSRGAQDAGLKVLWGVDNDGAARDSWQANFPRADCYHMCVSDFVRYAARNPQHVDILHLSPVCCAFSLRNTGGGKDDEKNEATLWAVEEMLRIVKPRMCTLEQVEGLVLQEKFSYAMKSLIRQFTSMGYSIRWRVCELVRWGLPQKRRRLLCIAAAPRQPLPDFPAYTHAEYATRDLKAFVTINRALGQINRRATEHDPQDLHLPLMQPMVRWNGDTQTNTILTKDDKDWYHPSGTRRFTIREVATLQGFAQDHKFKGTKTEKRRQIGNAVPSSVARVLFEHIRKALEDFDATDDTDDIMAPSSQQSAGSTANSPIILD